MAVQTPKQRIANEKFNKRVEKHRKYGKKKVKGDGSKFNFPISKTWLFVLAFLLVGGGLLELLSHFL
ncbi:hypothetical protein HG535_0A07840 [Zygotorulaspora mrakii]|uniref:Stress-associated endoplasmic reticulum protein n=1 Tax=Zygotorulaspora mrakii TaxID=42260 RepID=A0A7H9AX35_ZYGMR|nr:uncharacterized protein HG535_0A07840 [Zygotorulaspora mrakii]QLG70841.1 hypothetical protein HG535_0A07840 [Zygotorulaspora mrakii]